MRISHRHLCGERTITIPGLVCGDSRIRIYTYRIGFPFCQTNRNNRPPPRSRLDRKAILS